MELTNLLAVYGKPNIIECPQCKTEGCDYCHKFGYIAETKNKDVILGFSFPFFVDVAKRENAKLLQIIIFLTLTLILISVIYFSYISNFPG